MQVKYIVYYKENNPIPEVDIWETTGEITHPIYIKSHNIDQKKISSIGYIKLNFKTQKWELDHCQVNDEFSLIHLKEMLKMEEREKRDRILIQKKISQTPFLISKHSQQNTPIKKLSTLQND